jgi:hypothetical protein
VVNWGGASVKMMGPTEQNNWVTKAQLDFQDRISHITIRHTHTHTHTHTHKAQRKKSNLSIMRQGKAWEGEVNYMHRLVENVTLKILTVRLVLISFYLRPFTEISDDIKNKNKLNAI